MSQIFHRSTNTISRASVFGAVFVLAALVAAGYLLVRSPYVTGVGVPYDQPIPFSHKHHVLEEGIDCRYCHTTVETSSFAGMPTTQTCMNCHQQIFNQSPLLAAVRTSFQNGQPIVWNRVDNLPGYVYFDHSIHVQKGMGCSTCHGQVDQMPLTWKDQSMLMSWCVGCHMNPAQYVRPRDQVFNMDYRPPADQTALGAQLVQQYGIKSLLSCSTCHR